MKVWVTKYALTCGIEEIEAEASAFSENMITETKDGNRWCRSFHVEGKEWHRTHGNAVKRALEMKEKKLASLAKQITRLENLKF